MQSRFRRSATAFVLLAAASIVLSVPAAAKPESIANNALTSPAWSPWESLGGTLARPPAAVSSGTGNLDVLVVGPDQSIWDAYYRGGPWQWMSVNNHSSSDLGAAGNPAVPGVIDLYARSVDSSHGLIALRFGISSSGGWTAPTGELAAEPSGVLWSSSDDAYAEGTDGQLWRWQRNPSLPAGAWTPLGGHLSAAPAAIGSSGSSGQSWVFVRGTDKALWYWSSTDGWHDAGGQLASKPSPAIVGHSLPDVFVEGTDGALWRYSLETNRWQDVGGHIVGTPSAVAQPGLLSIGYPYDVFVEGTDHAVWHASYDGSSWSWESLGGYIVEPPSAVSWGRGRFDVFARGGDNALWHRYFQ